MGMYTELFMQVRLNKNTPKEVLDTLLFMTGQSDNSPSDQPFKADRWAIMLRCSSFYHYPFSHSKLDGETYSGSDIFLFVRCDFKNYTGELKGFLDWISPHISSSPGHYEGHYRYEEEDTPTRLFFSNGGYSDGVYNIPEGIL